MRVFLFILILAVVAIIAGIASGFINVNQTREAQAPTVAATRNGVTAKGGQAPAFDVQTGSVKVGTAATTVRVPALTVQKPSQSAQSASTNNAM
jgi:hypothetical protein